jgi:hypothetical protein
MEERVDEEQVMRDGREKGDVGVVGGSGGR